MAANIDASLWMSHCPLFEVILGISVCVIWTIVVRCCNLSIRKIIIYAYNSTELQHIGWFPIGSNWFMNKKIIYFVKLQGTLRDLSKRNQDPSLAPSEQVWWFYSISSPVPFPSIEIVNYIFTLCNLVKTTHMPSLCQEGHFISSSRGNSLIGCKWDKWVGLSVRETLTWQYGCFLKWWQSGSNGWAMSEWCLTEDYWEQLYLLL